jgi:MFS family permease
MAWLIARACSQAITIDEATTYALFVANNIPMQWLGSSNNHVLNTALMRLSTRVFGLSEISARLPAMLGAAIYIAACYRLCRRIGGGIVLQWALLVCLIGNPFIMDFLVAARGYGLALGFLMTALVADRTKLASCAISSACIGLVFAANFSFAMVCAAFLIALFLWSWREAQLPLPKLLIAYSAPAILVTWLLPMPSLLKFPTAELFYGSHSVTEFLEGLYISSLFQLNPHVLNPKLLALLTYYQPWFYTALGLTFVVWAAYVIRRLEAPRFAMVCGGVVCSAFLLHLAAFYWFGLLLPKERTGIFFVPLAFAAIGAIAAVAAESRVSQWMRGALIAALLGVAINNLGCLRLHYFREWNWNEDDKDIHAVLTCLHERDKVNHVASGWPFVSVLNFYRRGMPRDTYGEIADASTNPTNAEVYVVDRILTPGLLEPKHLTVAWKGANTNSLIAISPEHKEALQSSVCWEIAH